MHRIHLALLGSLLAAPAFAQAAYVVVAIGVDVTRLGRTESGGYNYPNLDGEVIGGALRVGTALGDRWGAELELARSGVVENESTTNPPFAIPLSAPTITASGSVSTASNLLAIFPIRYTTDLRLRNTTLAASAWIRQPVGSTVDLVYLAGIGFSRTVQEQDLRFATPLIATIAPQFQLTRVTSYNASPFVGFEARIGLTDHVRLVPGVRLQGFEGPVGSGWLIRPGVGLGWFF